jgi:uncharacterized protein involved in exopolysaccharide biosynthesis
LPQEPTLLDYGRAVLRHRRLMVMCAVSGTFLATAIALVLPPEFRAEAIIYVPSRAPFYAAVIRQTESPLPVPDPSAGSADYIVAVLNSRVLAQAVVREVDFPYPPGLRRAAAQAVGGLDERVGALQKITTIRERRGLITIAVNTADPVLAMKTANAYVRLLDRHVQRRSTQRRRFVESQLDETRAALREAEEAYRRFQDREGVVALDVELQETIKALVALEAEVAKTDAALEENGRMAQETGSLAEIAALQTQRAGLRGRQAELRRLVSETRARLGAVPAQALQAARLRREVEIQARRYVLLLEQYQLARISEQQEEALFQSIDPAVLSERPVRPRPVVNAALGTSLGLLVGVVAAVVLEMRNP